MTRYHPHALFQMQRRGITQQQVEMALTRHDETESRDDKRSFLRCFPEKGKKLRVVTRLDDIHYVITAYFDRRKPCK
uniref:DUF4258 domain-containing protein n=1 Tax=Candidatus Kentrum sp. TC TaxID=2126339 RepID=A0A450Z6N4_9GAMM|nr:MAG: protein of unknown function (DUF4258) [Candidatus Kentron sp. TC]